MNRVIVHVERVVLRGVREADKSATIDGLQQLLARAFADGQALSRLEAMGHVATFRMGHIKLGQGTRQP